MKMWTAGDNVEGKEGPVLSVAMVLAADKDGQLAWDALAPMAAKTITVVWSKKEQAIIS